MVKHFYKSKLGALVIIILLLAVSAHAQKTPSRPFNIIIKPKQALITNSKYWTELEFTVTIENTSEHELNIVSTEVGGIFPSPYLLKVNGKEARLWSGSILCGAEFSRDGIIKLEKGQKFQGTILWHQFVENFSKKPGIYRFALQYSYNPQTTFTIKTSKEGLNEIESEWSNEVEVKITTQ